MATTAPAPIPAVGVDGNRVDPLSVGERVKRPLALVLLLALTPSCASRSPSPAGDDGSPSAEPSGSGRLVVNQSMDDKFCCYIEGYLWFVEISLGSEVVFESRGDFGKAPLSRNLPTGSYDLTFYVRPCSGNCGELDAPAERCSAPFTIADGAVVTATIVERPGKNCSISIS